MCADAPRAPPEIVAVEELSAGLEASHFTVTGVFDRARLDGPLTWTGNLPVRVARPLQEAGHDVRELLGAGVLTA
jgi:hypothetical protein